MKSLVSVLLLVLALCVAHGQPGESSASADAVFPLNPHLQVLSGRSVAVQWRTEQPASGWVEFGEPGTPGKRQYAVENGLRAANITHHRVVLDELSPGREYWYRVCARPIRKFAAYQVEFGPDQRSELRTFRALPAPEAEVRAVIFNDLHNGAELFNSLLQACVTAPFDFSLFNGDCFADPATESQALSVLKTYNRGVKADVLPTLFVRGNHETRGAFARNLPELLAWPGGKPYFAFTAGPVRFLVLDCGEDKSDDHKEYAGLVDFESFREEQTAWLKQELASKAFRQPAWRVLVVHIPFYLNGAGHPAYDRWAPLLAKARIDLALSAHVHRIGYYAPGAVKNPFPFFTGGGSRLDQASVMLLEASPRELRLRLLNSRGADALPAFSKAR